MTDHLGVGLRGRTGSQSRVRTAAPGGSSRRTFVNAAAFSHYFSRPLLGLGPLLFAAAVISALYIGWINRDEGYITGESGLGYWLGIIGSLMMLLLLLYPLRKRARFLRGLGRVPAWFRSHMFLGIIGPTLVVFHANFQSHSLNATVALFFMLIIVASGIIGRYLYSKIHKGLYGAKAEIKEILADADLMKRVLGGDYEGASRLISALAEFEARALVPHSGFLSSLWAFIALGLRSQYLRGHLVHEAKLAIDAEAKQCGWGWRARHKRLSLVKEHLSIYFAAVNKAARFSVYERIFAYWHVLHLPLFFLLVLTAILHVIAVHLY
jgi:hypothetical protein